jgi:hypothetical protein
MSKYLHLNLKDKVTKKLIKFSNTKICFIVSNGRTGTEFLADFFNNQTKGVLSLHEPDPDLWQAGTDYERKKIDENKARQLVYKTRLSLILRGLMKRKFVYIESNNNLSFLIPIIIDLFPECRILHIVRDFRALVRSSLSKIVKTDDDGNPLAYFMDENDKRKRLMALDYQQDPLFSDWDKLTRFEKICWYHYKKDEITREALRGVDNKMLIPFENIFNERTFMDSILNMLNFFEIEKNLAIRKEQIVESLSKKRNYTKKHFIGPWDAWAKKQQDFFIRILGETMKYYGYSLD